MNQEITFKIIFWAQLVLIMVFNRILPAFQARLSGVKLSPDHEAIQNEGKFWFAFRVVAGILLAAALVIYSFFPMLNAHFQIHLPILLRWAGVILSSLCLLLWIYSQQVLAQNWSANLKIQTQHTLVTTGLYKVMRNPIYTAMIFWSAGLAMFTANAFFTVFAVVMFLWTPPRIAKEEKLMIDHFGDKYLEYMKTTGRYLPKFKNH